MNSDLFADRLATLRADLAQAERDLDLVHRRLRNLRREHAECKAVVERLTFAIAQLESVVTRATPYRERLDITEAVFAFLFDGGPHDVGELAAAIDRKRSQIEAACTRLFLAGRIELVAGTSDRYRIRQDEQRAAE